MVEKVRLDKFVWAVRLYKKRPDAETDANKGAILVNNMPAKPSRGISVGDEIYIKEFVIFRIYKVKALLEKRVGASLVPDYITEITSNDDLFKLKLYFDLQKTSVKRDKPGRPTKKDRRDLDRFMDDK